MLDRTQALGMCATNASPRGLLGTSTTWPNGIADTTFAVGTAFAPDRRRLEDLPV